MSTIQRINYKNGSKENCAIEVIDLQLFMATRPHHHLNRDFRLTFWMMMYIVEGQGVHYVDFEAQSYKAGDILIVQQNQVNRFVVNDQAQGYIIIVNEKFMFDRQGMVNETIMEFLDRPYRTPIVSADTTEGSSNRTIIELMYKEYMKSNGYFNENLIRALFQSFIYSLEDDRNDGQASMDSAVYRTYHQFSQLVEANYTTLRSVEDYSNLMLVSKKTINSATRSIVDLSAKQFIINRVILEIKRYLSQGDLRNYEISDLLGFDEPSNLTNFFKRYEGMSPSAFKASLN